MAQEFVTPTLEQMMALVEECPEIRCFDRGEYFVFDYVVTTPTTFDNPIALESRGIAFDKTGNIISRPLHKFFNMGEKEFTLPHNLDLSQPHEVVTKSDGSMIRTIKVGDSWRLGTRAGVTDIAMMAETFVASRENYITFINDTVKLGYTAIFEFCSRKNRVVIDYPEDRLILLAVRVNETGEYASPSELEYLCQTYFLDYLPPLNFAGKTAAQVGAAVEPWIGQEGVIIWFTETGFRVKIKALDYVKKHGALDGLRSSNATVQLILNNELDDVKPFLDLDILTRVRLYEQEFWAAIHEAEQTLVTLAQRISSMGFETRKELAAHVISSHKEEASDIFAIIDGKPFSIASKLSGAGNKTARELSEKYNIPQWNW